MNNIQFAILGAKKFLSKLGSAEKDSPRRALIGHRVEKKKRGLEYSLSCQERHFRKEKERRRKANKQARRSRRINRRRGIK